MDRRFVENAAWVEFGTEGQARRFVLLLVSIRAAPVQVVGCGGLTMVHIEDLGSEFDAPIDVVWKFIESEDDHGRSHSNRRNVQGAPDAEGGMRLSWEQNVQGTWVKVVNQVTMFPPVATMVHSIEGPLAGSKFLMYYRPNGAKTGVNVVGDFHSAMIPPARLEPTVLASLEEAYNDDNAALRRLVTKK